MTKARTSLAMTFLLAAPALCSAQSAVGEVETRKPGCSYFTIETAKGYALLEWYGGSVPSVGDTLSGELEKYGFQDVVNVTAKTTLKVWVHDYWLSSVNAAERHGAKCPARKD
jgi:hypothetical protein